MPPKKDDATSGEKVLKLYNILMCDGKKHYQGDLAERLNCTKQTIIRLAATIESVIGANLTSGLSDGRKWYRMDTKGHRSFGLNFEELRYLNICRDIASTTLPAPVLKRIDDTILNLSISMAEKRLNACATQGKQFAFFTKGHIDYAQHYDTLNILAHAAEEKRICTLQYKANGKSSPKEHRFAPGRIVGMSNALYVLGAGVTEDFKDIRHLTNLAVHRIVDIKLTGHIFQFELPDACSNSFGLPWHEPRTFRIRFSPNVADYIRERQWADEQSMGDTEDGGVILEITTRSEPELMAWVRSFGRDAEPFDNDHQLRCY